VSLRASASEFATATASEFRSTPSAIWPKLTFCGSSRLIAGRLRRTNMQNFEIIVVDDKVTLAAIGLGRGGTSEDFIRESYAQLSFSEEELIRKGTGLLATTFPPSWRDLNGGFEEATDVEHGFWTTPCALPLVMIVVYDRRKRAPASEGDFLGIMSLGASCRTYSSRSRRWDRNANHERLPRRNTFTDLNDS
jgi:hypothetical protein